jgi:hypothetical protein
VSNSNIEVAGIKEPEAYNLLLRVSSGIPDAELLEIHELLKKTSCRVIFLPTIFFKTRRRMRFKNLHQLSTLIHMFTDTLILGVVKGDSPNNAVEIYFKDYEMLPPEEKRIIKIAELKNL